jgi:hypothetical protein
MWWVLAGIGRVISRASKQRWLEWNAIGFGWVGHPLLLLLGGQRFLGRGICKTFAFFDLFATVKLNIHHYEKSGDYNIIVIKFIKEISIY